MCKVRVSSREEFIELAARLKEEFGKIQVRLEYYPLVGKWFVSLYRFCKDFPPAGAYSIAADYATTDEKEARSLLDLGREARK